MRLKKRYLLYKIEGQQLDEKTARGVARGAVYSFLGQHGASEANAKVMGFDEHKQLFFLRCSLYALEEVIAALAFVTLFNGKPITLRLQKMSGSVKNVWNSKEKA